jgi:hypothetical protein
LCYRKRLLRITELWYDELPPVSGTDVVIINQAREPYPGFHWQEKLTLVLDLTRPGALLLADLKKNYRSEIRTAKDKDCLCCTMTDTPGPALRTAFYDFYDAFARAKGLDPIDRNLMERRAWQGTLAIASVALDTPGATPLVFHAYLVQGGRARSLYSASQRLGETQAHRLNLIGRANRLLHWEDILWFRAKGLRLYDFGGWYGGTEDREKLAINRFKEGFGGTRITEYETIQGVTLLGKVGVSLWHLMKGH